MSFARSKTITQEEDKKLTRQAVHTQHQPNDAVLAGTGELRTKTLKKHILVPVEETIKVPVVRKEASRTVQQQVVKGQKLVPVKKFKEVEETYLEVKEVTVNGRKEKRHTPVTRMRKVPYTDFETKEVDIVVDVPMEEVVTRTGYRLDKHVVSKVVEVEEDHIYEMRPVLVRKGDTRMTEKHEHHSFKTKHGKPAWDEDTQEGWLGRPRTPAYRPHLHRPASAGSIRPSTSGSARPMSRGFGGGGATMWRGNSSGTLVC
mmetsp:Transcript_52774/g.112961  ORF Transcript_52774/g.112961 Transcript_52774/m.112961 type:complete len:259 (-) Transcript_52774:126-902(-)